MQLTGFSVGSVSGVVLGGTLFDEAGYKAPFYLALGLGSLDVLFRASIIEHRAAFKWIVPIGRTATSVHEVFAEKPKVPLRTSCRGMLRCLQSPRILTVKPLPFVGLVHSRL